MAKAGKKTTTRRKARAKAPGPSKEVGLLESWSDPEWSEAWIEGLSESLPGVSFLDRDLELDRRLTVEVAGVDTAGRLVLVALSEGGPLELARVAELMAFAGHNSAVLARHLGDARLDVELPPRVVLVLLSGEEPLAWRFAPFLEQGLEVTCMRTIKSAGRSAGRERVYLVPAEVHGPGDVALLGDGREGFLEGFDPESEELAFALMQGLERIDDELEGSLSRRGATYRFRGTELLRLTNLGGRLEAAVGSDPTPREIRDAGDVEHLLDAVIDSLLELGEPALEGRQPEEQHARTQAVRPTPESSVPWDSSAGLLTPAEIEAFRE